MRWSGQASWRRGLSQALKEGEVVDQGPALVQRERSSG